MGLNIVMKKVLLFVVIITLTACIGNSNDIKNQHTYTPRVFDGDNLVLENKLLSKSHYDRVEVVLSYHNISYRRTGQTEIAFDTPISLELVWNCTSKAEDKEWLYNVSNP
jgi:hypothetical protein